MAQYQTRPAKALDKVDPVWARIRSEAEDVARREPEVATFKSMIRRMLANAESN